MNFVGLRHIAKKIRDNGNENKKIMNNENEHKE